MKKILLSIVAFAGLTLTLIPSLLVFSGSMPTQTNKMLMGIGMLLWFGAAPFRNKAEN